MFSGALTMGPYSHHSMAKQARLNNLLLKTLPLFCPIMAELLSNLKALVQRLFRYLLFRDFAFAFENLSTQLVSGFQNKVSRPDYFAGSAGRLQEAK